MNCEVPAIVEEITTTYVKDDTTATGNETGSNKTPDATTAKVPLMLRTRFQNVGSGARKRLRKLIFVKF